MYLRNDMSGQGNAPGLGHGRHLHPGCDTPHPGQVDDCNVHRASLEGFLEGVQEKGEHLRAGLEKLQQRYPDKISQIRGRGLIQGAVMKGKAPADYLAAFREREILVAPCGADLVRFLPPLVIEKKQIGEVVDVFDEILRQG